MVQLALLFSHNRESLQDYLEKETGKALCLVITDNSTSMLSVKTRGKSVSVRLHWIFLNAGNDVIREIAGFIKNRRSRTPLIGKFIKDNRHFLKENPCRPTPIRIHGRHFNLREIFNSINDEYFEGRITASITWGNRNQRWAVKRRTLGSYSSHTNTIRINPCLDRKNVPLYFLKFIVFHEMLHGDMHEDKKNGRRSMHSAEFRRRERLFRHYGKAVSWEKRLL